MKTRRLINALLCTALFVVAITPIHTSPAIAAASTTCALTWDLVASPTPAYGDTRLLTIDGAAADDIWAAGTMNLKQTLLLQHWNGGAWSLVTPPDLGNGTAQLSVKSLVTPAVNAAWLGGFYLSDRGSIPFILHWDGSTWSPLTLPFDDNTSIISMSAPGASNLWVTTSQVTGTSVWHWDDTTWAQFTEPIAGISAYYIYKVFALAADDVWLVGQYRQPDAPLGAPYYFAVTHWDGSGWTITSQFQSQTTDNYAGSGLSDAVMGFAVLDANNMWLLDETFGSASHDIPMSNTRVMHWDGITWQTFEQTYYPRWYAIDLSAANADAVWVLARSLPYAASAPSYTHHWDGVTYQSSTLPAPRGLPYLNAVKVLSANDIWIVGDAYGYPNTSQPYIVHGHLPCAAPPLGKPKLKKPAPNVIVTRKPNLNWSDVAGTHYYELELSRKPNFNHTVIKTITWESVYKIRTPLSPGLKYYWHTRACNNAGCSAWSNPRMFTTK